MRIQMTMTDLDEGRWAYLQSTVQAEYEIPEDATRVCLTFSHGEEEERHVEMPMGSVLGLLAGLGVLGLGQTIRTAMAALTPDALPDFLKSVRETADPALKDAEPGSTGPSYGAGPGEGR